MTLRSLFFVILLVLAADPASAQVGVFLNFTQWEQKTFAERVGYIEGAVDSLVLFGSTAEERQLSIRRSNCLRTSGITTGQLATNVLRFGLQRPELQGQPVQVALIQYLNAFCGG